MGLVDDSMMDDVGMAASDFGETVTYTFANGSTLSLSAIVVRSAPNKQGFGSRQLSYSTQIVISKSLLPSRPTLDQDRITITGTADSLAVARLDNEHDPAYWHITVN